MKRAALIGGASIAALLTAWALPASARTSDVESWWGRKVNSSDDFSPRKSRKRSHRSESKTGQSAEKLPPPPSGPLHVIVSIDKQRATLFADGTPIASTAVSTGTPSHPTPMGVFTVIQKDRYHVSNLYDAAMPYMQRITWSGSALHEGPLPGYPASHGCVRLTASFAQLLWRATKLGARVIVTRPDVAPAEFASPRLAILKPKPAPAPVSSEPAVTSSVIKTADAGNVMPVKLAQHDDAKPLEPATAANTHAEQPTKLSVTDGQGPVSEAEQPAATGAKPAEVPAAQAVEAQKPAETPKEAAKEAVAAKPVELAAPPSIIVDDKPAASPATVAREIKHKPISVFVSLKEGKLYVRQGWEPLFDSPITIEHPEQPIGTHVYTAMGLKADGDLRWTVVSIPSGYKRTAEPRRVEHGHKLRGARNEPAEEHLVLPSPGAALDRIVMPPELADRIAGLMMPGSSLIVSDNKLSDETDKSTDFIVMTR